MNWRFNRKSMSLEVETGIAFGPTNMAGQATRWVNSLRDFKGISNCSVFELVRAEGVYWDSSESEKIGIESWKSKKEADSRRALISKSFTHVLFEGGMPFSGSQYGPLCESDVDFFSKMNVSSGVILHGSDIRVPSIHRELNGSESPFIVSDEWSNSLEIKSMRLMKYLINNPSLPSFITTTDLFDFVDNSQWLPVTVNLELFVPKRQAFSNDEVRVLHLPSKRRIKGSANVDEIMSKLLRDKRLIYRSLEGLTQSQVIDSLNWADVVLDQFGVGGYGVFASEAMAMNRVVISRLTSTVTKNQPDLPIISASTEELPDVIYRLIEDLSYASDLANKGREYSAKYHSGEMSANILQGFL